MATAQARAADAEEKTTISPSPRFFTSVPPASAMAWRRIEKWPRRTSSAILGQPLDSSVEPTMSVNRIATFSVVTVGPPPPARPNRRRYEPENAGERRRYREPVQVSPSKHARRRRGVSKHRESASVRHQWAPCVSVRAFGDSNLAPGLAGLRVQR